jgi:enoyl-CoA hydratase/carnithine racemase
MKASGFVSRVLLEPELAAEAQATALRIAALAPQAARLNKRTIRAACSPLAPVNHALDATNSIVDDGRLSYAYADSTEHREGIEAFLQKRKPMF